ncbi:MAG: type II toxin-antitoxin system RelE/ParE family toxin [Holosporales bacterium]|jgi:hypothetical protein
MQILKNKAFSKFARKEGISNATLRQIVKNVNAGKIDVDYGGGVIKQRMARPGQGTSGGYRSIILFRKNERAVFVYGFAKKDRDNIGPDEVKAFKALAAITFECTDKDIDALIENGTYQEVA